MLETLGLSFFLTFFIAAIIAVIWVLISFFKDLNKKELKLVLGCIALFILVWIIFFCLMSIWC